MKNLRTDRLSKRLRSVGTAGGGGEPALRALIETLRRELRAAERRSRDAEAELALQREITQVLTGAV